MRVSFGLKFGLVFILILIIIFAFYYFKMPNKKNLPPTSSNSAGNSAQSQYLAQVELPANITPITQPQKPLGSPISNAEGRITKKPFGIYITPQNSPVQPEKFTGYHTGTDFETLPEETNVDVPISAICDGKIILKNQVSGYGGVIIESCILNKNPVTVLYGHLKLSGSPVNFGNKVSAGDQLAFLGAGYNTDTDGERKHLHLSIHKGNAIDYRGYVQNQSELNDWYDPADYINLNNKPKNN